MAKIEKEAYQKRLDRITALFGEMVAHADEQALSRCPYKNRFDGCTAGFGCRFQRKPRSENGLLACASDDRLDYRSAWETEPEVYAEAKARVRRRKTEDGGQKTER